MGTQKRLAHHISFPKLASSLTFFASSLMISVHTDLFVFEVLGLFPLDDSLTSLPTLRD